MSLFEFCVEIIKREGKKFNVGVDTTTAGQITSATASDVNFDIAHNRCSFLFRCGAINLSFARDCFKKFLSDEKSIVFLLSKWVKCPNLTVCSISNGPALDYVALLLSYQGCGMFPSLFKDVKVISKYGAWRNTVNIMLEILNEGYLECLPPSVSIGDLKVIEGDPFVEFNEKVKVPISNSDIVLMVKTLNLQADGYDKKKIAMALQEFLGALKPGAIVFCIDTKPSISVITQQLCSIAGNFLFEPTHMNTMINLEHTDFYKDIFGCFPVASARGSFFVWEKSSIILPPGSDCLMDEVSESVKRLLKISNSQNKDYSSKSPDTCNEQGVSMSTNVCEKSTVPNINQFFKSVTPNSIDQGSFANIGIQNSKYFSTQSQLQSRLPAYAKDENNGFSKESSKNSTSVNKTTQTEPEDLKGADSIKFIELTNRIAKLTTTISEMLQTNELSDCKNDSCLKNLETGYKHSVLNNCAHNYCFSAASSCPCANLSETEGNCCTTHQCEKNVFENCCHNHLCRQRHFTPCQHNSNVSFNNDFEASKYVCSCHDKLKSSAENNSASSPKLVIPLNNLSGSVVSQILSIISQSNQEQ